MSDKLQDQVENSDAARQYCATLSRQQQEDPVGTAPSHRRYLFVEVPLPWEVHVADSRRFPTGLKDMLARCEERCEAPAEKFRFLAFTSNTRRSPEGQVRVFYFWRPPFPCSAFRKREYIVPFRELNSLVEAILLNTGQLSAFDHALQPTEHIREFFVCTHGTHDRCCGKFGAPVYQFIENHYAADSGQNIRVWSTSHFGGHRLAPTLIDFPEGRYWAHATTDMLRMLIERKGPAAEITKHCRGWGMLGRFEQVAERELLSRFGWDWIHYDKEAEVLDGDDTSARVRIRYRSPGGEQGEYNAEVTVTGMVRIGGCGAGWSETSQYAVRPHSAEQDS